MSLSCREHCALHAHPHGALRLSLLRIVKTLPVHASSGHVMDDDMRHGYLRVGKRRMLKFLSSPVAFVVPPSKCSDVVVWDFKPMTDAMVGPPENIERGRPGIPW